MAHGGMRAALLLALALAGCNAPPDRRPAGDPRCPPWETAQCPGDKGQR